MKFEPTTLLTKIKEPVYLEKIVLILLNIIPEYYFVRWSMSISDQYVKLALMTLVILWLYGILVKKIYYAGLAYTLTSVILIAYNYDVETIFTTCFASSIWLMLSITLVSCIFEKGYKFKRIFSLKGVLVTIILFVLIYGTYIYIAYYLAHLVYDTYMYVISITPYTFQKFYEVFITTRIGSIILLLLFIFIIYYILNNYITLLISDTIALNKEFAFHRVVDILQSEAKNIFLGKDPFQKLFARSFLLIIMFYLYGITYPLYRSFYDFIYKFLSYFSLPQYVVLLAWFGLLYVVSYIVYKTIYSRIISVIKPSVSRIKYILKKTIQSKIWRPFYLFLFILVMYATTIALISPSEFSGILMRSLGLSKNINIVYHNPFLRF
ncbi:MAG: hypothetical protein J7J82_06315, partial [Staphylothermus sp.]|nr:hypothetical protein [Staphylothermus sp.]